MNAKLRLLTIILAGNLSTSVYAANPEEAKEAAQQVAPVGAKDGAKEATIEGVPERLKERVLKRYDANGNGKLDEDEKAKFLSERAKLGAVGKNGAGDDNRAQAGEELRKRIMQRFDKDGDGKLNADERAAAEKAREEMGKGGKKGMPSREEMTKRFDKNGDGKLDEEERQAARKAVQDRGGQKGKKKGAN